VLQKQGRQSHSWLRVSPPFSRCFLTFRGFLLEIQLNETAFLIAPSAYSVTRFNFVFEKAIKIGEELLNLVGRHTLHPSSFALSLASF
jgi:hypothetical protein